ncbi:MAG: pitrilysin family protein [Verrucomicrobiota bacterium]|nr:pitrilysin family protein [Verrucomicrobiota bacterium]
MYQTTQLTNGAKIATAYLPHTASVCMGVWVGTGSRHETRKQNGVSHFIEHVLFKGTKHRNAKEISETVEGLGGYLNAFTAEENTCYYAKAKADRFSVIAEVLMDMYLNPAFDPEEIRKEREVIKEELAMYTDQPSQLVLELLNEVLWPDHPLGRCITGTETTIDSLTPRRLKRFWQRHYVAQNTLIVVVGPLKHRSVVQRLRKHTRHIPSGGPPGCKRVHEDQSKPRLRLQARNSEQLQLAFGIKTCSRHGPHRYGLRILNTLLGENMSSRLFQRLREEHGLAYSVYSNLGFFDDVGFLTIGAGIDASQLEKAMTLIQETLEEFRSQKPSHREIKQARDYLIGHLDLHLENTENHMMMLGEQILGFGKCIRTATIHQELLRITPKTIQTIADHYFQPKNLNLAIVGKLAKKRLLGFDKWLT